MNSGAFGILSRRSVAAGLRQALARSGWIQIAVYDKRAPIPNILEAVGCCECLRLLGGYTDLGPDDGAAARPFLSCDRVLHDLDGVLGAPENVHDVYYLVVRNDIKRGVTSFAENLFVKWIYRDDPVADLPEITRDFVTRTGRPRGQAHDGDRLGVTEYGIDVSHTCCHRTRLAIADHLNLNFKVPVVFFDRKLSSNPVPERRVLSD